MEKKRPSEAAFVLLAAVVGAGFVSGREVLVFFARFGPVYSWGAVGIASACVGLVANWMMGLFVRFGTSSFSVLCEGLLGTRWGKGVSLLYAALLAVTGGAMASGIGEMAALTLPIHGAFVMGLVGGVALCALAAWKGLRVLASTGSVLVPVCGILYAVLMRRPAPAPVAYANALASPFWALPFGVCYAAMNTTLCGGLLGELSVGLSKKGRGIAALLAALFFGVLLVLANGALLPYARRLADAALPIVFLARSAGVVYAWLCVIALLLAMSTTLIAMLRAFSHWLAGYLPERVSPWVSAGVVLLLGAVGFNQLIGWVYPALGWLSAGAMACLLWRGRKLKKMENSSGRADGYL